MHVSRKLFHAAGVVIPVIYLWTEWERWIVATILGAIFLVLLIFDWVRHRFPLFEQRFQVAFRLLLDPKDSRGLNGSTLYFGDVPEPLHRSFSSSERLVGILGSIVEPPTALLVGGIADYLHRRSI